MAITEKQFRALRRNDVIIDGDGDRWEVVRNAPTHPAFSDVPGDVEVALRSPDGDVIEFGWSQGVLIDENWGRWATFEHPDARVESK